MEGCSRLRFVRPINCIEAILEKAETLLTAAATGELIDIDWGSRFFQKAQDVSEKEMQGIWASVLASQIRYPGLVSLHTLEVLGNLSKQEIDIFETANCLVSGHQYIWKIDGQDTDEVDAFGLSHEQITVLREVGLMLVRSYRRSSNRIIKYYYNMVTASRNIWRKTGMLFTGLIKPPYPIGNQILKTLFNL